MIWLETLTEKRIDEEENKDPTLTSIDIVKNLYKKNDNAKHKGITEEQLEAMNRDLWAVLVEKCENEAMGKVSSALQGEGLKAFVRIHEWFSKTTELGRTNRIIDIMRPDAVKHDHEIATAVEKWKERDRRIMEEDDCCWYAC